MSMLSTFLKPMHPEGWRFLAIFGFVTFLLFLLWAPLGWIGAGLTVWCYYFFRDPVRTVPLEPGLVLSPADGAVCLLGPAVPPAELGLGEEKLERISIFMSVFDCHVNRAPVAGRVERVAYHKGKFLNASLDKASEENERNALAIRMEDGRAIAVVQIAGLVARRILPFVGEGDSLRAGQRFGLIRFGSRLDVYLPPGEVPAIALGQRAIAGETVLARLGAGTQAMTARRE